MIPIVEILFPLLTVIPAYVVCLLLASHIGGWSKLAKHYPDSETCHGKISRFQSGHIGLVGYGLCLTLEVCETGLRLSIMFPFRIGHPPVFIPWEEFHSVSEKRVLFLRLLDT